MSSPPRQPVLLCSTAPPEVCGIGDYTARLAAALRDGGAPPAVWTRRGLGIARWDGASLRTLAARLSAERPPLLHLQYETSLYDDSPAFPFVVARAARQADVPLVTTLHSLDGPPRWGRAHRAALLPL